MRDAKSAQDLMEKLRVLLEQEKANETPKSKIEATTNEEKATGHVQKGGTDREVLGTSE